MAKVEPFERYSSDYDNWFVKNHFVYSSELEAIDRVLPGTGRSLEIGVGTGRFAHPLGIELGLEPSKAMLNIARQRGIEALRGIAEELPFKNDQFDTVLMVTTICFLDDIKSAFIEVRRILKHAGRFIIGFVDKDSSLGKFYAKNEDRSEFYRMATFYSVAEIISHLRRSGFGHFDFRQTIFQSLNNIRGIELVERGFGRGSFVVVSAGDRD
jgi:SAM-dependent methyltransferase